MDLDVSWKVNGDSSVWVFGIWISGLVKAIVMMINLRATRMRCYRLANDMSFSLVRSLQYSR